MDTLECIKTRRSVRKFKDKAVEWEKVVNILHAGRLAPSAGNLQNWKFIAIREEENRKAKKRPKTSFFNIFSHLC